MGKRVRFVQPVVDRLELTDGDWLEVKHQLTVGERRGILSRAAKGGVSTDGQRVHLDGAEMAFARAETWLLDWSFQDAAGKPMKLSPAALRALDAESFAEIEAALDAHEEAVDAAKNSSASMASGSSTPTPPRNVSEASSPSASGSDTPTGI
jgi:hypothetical protein